jgi:hypothetical protein
MTVSKKLLAIVPAKEAEDDAKPAREVRRGLRRIVTRGGRRVEVTSAPRGETRA